MGSARAGMAGFLRQGCIVREAGVTRTRVDGVERFVPLRDDDVEARFPGLLPSVLAAVAPKRQRRREALSAAAKRGAGAAVGKLPVMSITAEHAASIETLNPATGETLARYEPHGKADIGARLDAAVAAQRRWRETPFAKRG